MGSEFHGGNSTGHHAHVNRGMMEDRITTAEQRTRATHCSTCIAYSNCVDYPHRGTAVSKIDFGAN